MANNRKANELNFFKDEVLFPDEAPRDIIGVCIGLDNSSDDCAENKCKINITAKRIRITQGYTDIRREIINMLLMLWRNENMRLHWIKKHFKELGFAVGKTGGENSPSIFLSHSDLDANDELDTSVEDIQLLSEILRVFNPDEYSEIKSKLNDMFNEDDGLKELLEDKGLFFHDTEVSEGPKRDEYCVNGEPSPTPPLLGVVRPTLFIFTTDSACLEFVDNSIEPRKSENTITPYTSNRLDPYCDNIRLWFERSVMGWYSSFDTDEHRDGGEFWYNLKVGKKPINCTNVELYKISEVVSKLLSVNGITLVDPGNGNGGGDRFP